QPRYHLEMALLRWIYLRKLTPIEDLVAAAGSVPSRPAPAAPASTPGRSGPKSPDSHGPASSTPASGDASLKERLLAEISKSKTVFYKTVVAQAQKIEVSADRVTFTFSASQRALRDQLEQNRVWLESLAAQAAGRKVAIVSEQNGAPPEVPVDSPQDSAADRRGGRPGRTLLWGRAAGVLWGPCRGA